jgi:hypothetical protein
MHFEDAAYLVVQMARAVAEPYKDCVHPSDKDAMQRLASRVSSLGLETGPSAAPVTNFPTARRVRMIGGMLVAVLIAFSSSAQGQAARASGGAAKADAVFRIGARHDYAAGLSHGHPSVRWPGAGGRRPR